ncbi:MAG: DUF4332 domain-containing protein [Candidatus Bathyarchaeia archaeon]
MEREIEKLRKELATLKAENADLKKAIADMQRGFAVKIEPNSLIKSIQRDLINVDEFATKQERPTTYVVSDFNLQLKAVVSKDGERVALILPSRPGEIDPNLMSTVNLALKPVPVTPPTVRKPHPAESVEVIEGIGPEIAKKLRSIAVNTVSDLALSSVDSLKRASISEKVARELIGMAKLMVKSELAGLSGVDEEAAELLVRGARIDSKEKLAEANPEELYAKLKETVDKRAVRLPKGYTFTVDDVKRWVESAKAKVL